MNKYDFICAEIQSKLRALSSSDDISAADLIAFNKQVNELLEQIKVSTEQQNKQLSKNVAAKTKKQMDEAKIILHLTNFLTQIQAITEILSNIAESLPNAKGFPTPGELLQQLAVTYEKNVEPMLVEMSKDSQHIAKVSLIAGAATEVFSSCRNINKHRENMDTKEKLYAVLGAVLMFAGIGMMIAATVNPVTMPIIAAITVVTLGCFLCRRAMKRHQDNKKDELSKSLDRVDATIDAIGEKNKISKNKRHAIKFSAAVACGVAAEPTPEIKEKLRNELEEFFKKKN